MSIDLTDSILIILFSYVFGSISSAIMVCKLAGLPDPRNAGSNNPGATNILRIAGKKYALLTLAGDMLKGFIPVVLAKYLAFPEEVVAIVLLAVVLGHIFPIFFKFRGGKGVATAFGSAYALHWVFGLIVTAEWLIVAAISKYSSLSALMAFTLAPFIYWISLDGNWSIFVALLLQSVLLILRHRKNIKRILAGTEPKIGQK